MQPIGFTDSNFDLPPAPEAPATQPAPAPSTGSKPVSKHVSTAHKHNDDILFVGMNPDASHEADALKPWAHVTVIGNSKLPDQVRLQDGHGPGQLVNLAEPAGRLAFAAQLHLPAPQSKAIADALGSAEPDSRDELAEIARVWSKAERGGSIPSRLVLSGHCAGSGIWGQGNGTLSWESLGKLAAAMPKASRQVEDLHLAACYSGSADVVDRMRAMFPKAKTIWAYDGSAPGGASGATTHEKLWERSTRGPTAHLDRNVAAHTRKGENVAVWTAAKGLQNGRPPLSLQDAYQDVASAAPAFDAAFNGAAPVPDAQSGPLRDYYNKLQRLLENPALPPASRQELMGSRDTTLRLLYYASNVAPRFAQSYSREIQQGYAALNMSPPDFSSLGRKDALNAAAEFKSSVDAQPQPDPAATRLRSLLDGLGTLDPKLIPNRWL